MGLIAQRLAEVRFSPTEWLNDDGDEGQETPSGVRVTSGSALGISTFWRCVDLISHAVSNAPRDVFIKVGGRSFPEYNPPAWLSQPDPSNPNYSGDDYFGEMALSMLIDGNAFAAVYPYVWDPQVVTILDPARVRVISGPRYELLDARGQVTRTLDAMQVIHGWWMREAGALRGISPLERFRRSLGGAIAAEDFAGRFFGQGASLSFGVEVPYAMDAQKINDLRDSLKRKYSGRQNSHAIGVLADGGKFVTGLAPTPEQAQMLATRKFSVEDIARIYGVPPGMAGAQEPGASSYASAIEWRKQFRDDAVLKFTRKLEVLHERLLTLPIGIDPRAKVQLRFNLDWIARTDLLARYQAHAEGVRGGFLTPNEARGYEDMAPKPGGDDLFMQSQMVPLGQITQPPAAQRADPVAVPEVNVTVADGAFRSDLKVVLPESISIPETPAPIVNVAAPVVNVSPPEVHVAPPDMDAVTDGLRALREQIDAPVRKHIRRDAQGLIADITEQRMSPKERD